MKSYFRRVGWISLVAAGLAGGGCVKPPEGMLEDCTDGVDNNADGLIDCDDPICTDTRYGHYSCMEDCLAPGDEDEDGYADCDDPDCSEGEYHYYYCPVPEVCSGNLDEDGDGYWDCDDSDCADDPACGGDGSGGNAGTGGEDGSGGTGGQDTSGGGSSTGGAAGESSGGASGGETSGGGTTSGGGASGGGASGGGASGGETSGGGTTSGGGSDGTGGTVETGGAFGAGGFGGAFGSGGFGSGTGGSGGGAQVVCPLPLFAQEGVGFVEIGSLGDSYDFTSSWCQKDTSGADIPIYYMAPDVGTLTVQAYSTSGDIDLSVRTVCNDPSTELPLACSATVGAGQQEEVVVETLAAQELFIIVSGADASVDDSVFLSIDFQ